MFFKKTVQTTFIRAFSSTSPNIPSPHTILSKDCFYEILGVAQDASKKDIKQNFVKLTKEYHPDVNDGGIKHQKMYSKISEAYEILNNKNKRREYD